MFEQWVTVEVVAKGEERTLSWTRVYVRKSLDEICHSIEVELSPSERPRIALHDWIIVRRHTRLPDRPHTRLVTVGRIDEIRSAADRDQTLLVTARSPARDIVDSTWSGSLSGLTFLGVVEAIAAQCGLKAMHMPTNVGDTTGQVSHFAWNQESPWQKLVLEADNQGVIVTSNQAGDLYVWRVASAPRAEGFAIKEADNATVVRDVRNGSEQYHHYIFIAETPSGRRIKVTTKDTDVPNTRVLTIHLPEPVESETALRQRATTDMNRRRAHRITVGLPGWGLLTAGVDANVETYERQRERLGQAALGHETMWEPNFLTPVTLPSLGLRSARMLTCQVEYRADRAAMSCDVTLVPRETYTNVGVR